MLGAGSGRVEEINRHGLAAAIAVAADQGLPADDPRVLSARGNLIVHLADLEEACRGPREFDLAVMAGRQGAHSAAALAAYCDVTGTAPPETGALAPFARARQLEGAVWALGMAHQYPARYRDIAAKMLDSVMHAAGSMP